MKDLLLFIWYLGLATWLYGNWIGNLSLRVSCTVILILITVYLRSQQEE